MSNNKPETQPFSSVERRLEELKNVPPRDPLRAASGRTRFLREAAEYRQAVSLGSKVRQRGWIFPIRKEKFTMNALVTLILVASMLLGGGATVAAAQDDLPNQPLYQVKLWTENATLAMNGDPQEQANLLMTMAQTRTQEMAALVEQGVVPPAQVRTRLEQHINQALQLAANMNAADCEQTLLQVRERLQTQDRLMQQLQTHANAETEPLLTQTRQMLQTRLRLVDAGLADPQGFRYIMQNQMQYGQEEEVTPEPNQQGEPGFHQNGQPTATDEPTDVPGNGNENNNSNGNGNETPGNSSENGNGSGGSSNDTGGQNQDNSSGGNSSGSDNNGGNSSGGGSDSGNGTGGGGKN